jgi:hypothetical protein
MTPSLRVLEVKCPLGCESAQKAGRSFEQAVQFMQIHFAADHGDLVESELSNIVLEERYKLVCYPDLIRETHGCAPFLAIRLECPLGCSSFKRTLTELGKPLDELTMCLGGLSPNQLKVHLETKHPGCPEAGLSTVELVHKYKPLLPPSFHRIPLSFPPVEERHQGPVEQGLDNVDIDMENDPEGSDQIVDDVMDYEMSADEPESLNPATDDSMDVDQETETHHHSTTPELAGWGDLRSFDVLCQVASVALEVLDADVAQPVANPPLQQPSNQVSQGSEDSDSGASASESNTAAATAPSPVRHHGMQDPQLKDDPTRTFVCEICGYRYRTKDILQRHFRKVHPRDNPFKCNLCIKSYVLQCRLDTHVRKVHGDQTN